MEAGAECSSTSPNRKEQFAGAVPDRPATAIKCGAAKSYPDSRELQCGTSFSRAPSYPCIACFHVNAQSPLLRCFKSKGSLTKGPKSCTFTSLNNSL